MKLKCYIVDDREASINLLKRYISQTPDLELIGATSEARFAVEKISNNEILPDITFLDIEMPYMSGIEIAALIAHKTNIIFTTGHAHYGPEAFELETVDYLLKPFTYDRFLKSVKKVQDKLQLSPSPRPYYLFPSVNSTAKIKIRIAEIQYVKAINNMTQVSTKEKKYLINLSLKDALNVLSGYPFIQVHKSYLINIDQISILESDFIEMENKERIPIGRSYKPNLKKIIS